jgi:hypothetical protein
MTKINSNKSKNKVILPLVIIAAIVVTGIYLANPVISLVTALQASNVTLNEREEIFSNQSPKINGSINILEKTQAAIENDLQTSFVEAAEVVTRQANNDTILLGGHLAVDHGYLVYKFFSIDPVNHTGYKTIIDAGNSAVLYKSEDIQMMDFFDKSGDQGMEWPRMYGFSSDLGYGQGQGPEHKPFGFGHWKGPWGFHGHGDSNDNGPWR